MLNVAVPEVKNEIMNSLAHTEATRSRVSFESSGSRVTLAEASGRIDISIFVWFHLNIFSTFKSETNSLLENL